MCPYLRYFHLLRHLFFLAVYSTFDLSRRGERGITEWIIPMYYYCTLLWMRKLTGGKKRREPCLLYTKSDLLGQVSGLLICFVEIYLGWGFCRDLATLPCELQNSTHRTDRGRKKGFLQSLYLKNKKNKKKKKKKRVAYLLWSVYLNITYCTLYALSKCKQI